MDSRDRPSLQPPLGFLLLVVKLLWASFQWSGSQLTSYILSPTSRLLYWLTPQPVITLTLAFSPHGEPPPVWVLSQPAGAHLPCSQEEAGGCSKHIRNRGISQDPCPPVRKHIPSNGQRIRENSLQKKIRNDSWGFKPGPTSLVIIFWKTTGSVYQDPWNPYSVPHRPTFKNLS